MQIHIQIKKLPKLDCGWGQNKNPNIGRHRLILYWYNEKQRKQLMHIMLYLS